MQTNPNRCWVCDKKLRFGSAFQCRCDYYFCGLHRYSDKHECKYDYKGDGASTISKANPTIAFAKLDSKI